MAAASFYRNRWFQAAVSAAILAILARSLDLDTLSDFVSRADPWLLLLLVLFFPADRIFMAWKWHLLVRSEGSTMGLWTAIRIYLASSVVGLVIPLGGVGPDMARVAMLSHHGMPTHVSIPSIFVERVCGLLGSGIMLGVSIGLLVLLLGVDVVSPFKHVAWIVAWTLLLVSLGIGACYALARVTQIARSAGSLIDRFGLRSHLQTLRSYANKGSLLGLSVFLAWTEQWASIIAYFLACKAFSVPLSLLQVAAIVPFASIMERLPISFGGFGVREATIVIVAGYFGVPAAEAFLLSIATDAIYLLTMVPLAALYFLERKDEERKAEPA